MLKSPTGDLEMRLWTLLIAAFLLVQGCIRTEPRPIVAPQKPRPPGETSLPNVPPPAVGSPDDNVEIGKVEIGSGSGSGSLAPETASPDDAASGSGSVAEPPPSGEVLTLTVNDLATADYVTFAKFAGVYQRDDDTGGLGAYFVMLPMGEGFAFKRVDAALPSNAYVIFGVGKVELTLQGDRLTQAFSGGSDVVKARRVTAATAASEGIKRLVRISSAVQRLQQALWPRHYVSVTDSRNDLATFTDTQAEILEAMAAGPKLFDDLAAKFTISSVHVFVTNAASSSDPEGVSDTDNNLMLDAGAVGPAAIFVQKLRGAP